MTSMYGGRDNIFNRNLTSSYQNKLTTNYSGGGNYANTNYSNNNYSNNNYQNNNSAPALGSYRLEYRVDAINSSVLTGLNLWR